MEIAHRFNILEGLRTSKLERSRYYSTLTVPSLLPPEGWTEQDALPQPFSSTAARGVTSMASRMLSALLPLNDMPFFKFEMKSGEEPDPEVYSYLDALSYQVYSRLSTANLREIIYQTLQHLIVVGDVLLIMDDDFNFRVIRLDQYVCRRDVHGNVEELIFIEFQSLSNEEEDVVAQAASLAMSEKKGYKKIYVRAVKNKETEAWEVEKQDEEGAVLDKGEYKTLPYIALRWSGIPGENYGRSHVEDVIGDIKALEAFTEGLIYGVTASSLFWMACDPAGMTELDDITSRPTGSWVSARAGEVFTISPADTMNPQIQSTQAGVGILREELGKAFLMGSSSIPTGDRVTATAVRMVGQELEHVLGGAFSAIARELMQPIVERAIFLMINEGDIDERLNEMFDDQGLLDVEIVTGLQALSRDSDLQKLMQMGEMVRNLPEQAAAMFKWDQYGKALITSLGFAPDTWIKSEEEVQQEQMAMQQQQMAMQAQQQAQMGMTDAMTQGAAQMAQQDIMETGGQGIQQMMEGVM
tara:strand:+ start:1349 stop:2929 length:1581 start_codon:yes stop_codon:yes gene_type:complete